jgi:hypothetical protein
MGGGVNNCTRPSVAKGQIDNMGACLFAKEGTTSRISMGAFTTRTRLHHSSKWNIHLLVIAIHLKNATAVLTALYPLLRT